MEESKKGFSVFKLPTDFKLNLLPTETDNSSDDVFLAKNIIKRTPLTLPKLAEKTNTTIGALPDQFKRIINEIPDSIDLDILPLIDLIYGYYSATRSLPPNHELSDFALTLDSFDGFIGSYFPNMSLKRQAHLITQVNDYIDFVVHPSQLLTVESERDDHPKSRAAILTRLGVYNSQGLWVRFDTSNDGLSRRFIGDDVVEELVELKESNGVPISDVYHETSSVALNGIAAHRALLSSQMAIERGEKVKSGEFVTHIGWDNTSPTGEMTGLGDIYGSKGITGSYMPVRWFNEFPVVFGFSKPAILEFYKSKGLKEKRLEDWTGEGVALGSELPLGIINSAYTLQSYLPRLKSWVDENAPSARATSLEAAQVYRPDLDFSRLSNSPKLKLR